MDILCVSGYVPLRANSEFIRFIMTTGTERRRAPRFPIPLPLRIPGSGAGRVFGVTRDVSSAGVYFYTESDEWQEGSRIEFIVNFPPQVSGETATTLCGGTVVRTENVETVLGVAVQIQRISFVDN